MIEICKKTVFKFLKNEQAITSVELAFISPLVIFLFIAVIELAFLSLAQSTINALTRDIARLNITSYNPLLVQSRTDQINALAASSLAGTFDTGSFVLDTRVTSGFSSLPPIDPNNVSTQYGSPNDVVVYRVSADHSFLVPGFAILLGGPLDGSTFRGQNKIKLSAQLVVRNEP